MESIKAIFAAASGFIASVGASFVKSEDVRQDFGVCWQTSAEFNEAKQTIAAYPDSRAGLESTREGNQIIYPETEPEILSDIEQVQFFRNFDPATASEAEIDQAITYMQDAGYPYNAIRAEDLKASIADGPPASGESWTERAQAFYEETGQDTALRDLPPDDNLFSLTDRYQSALEADVNPDVITYVDAQSAQSLAQSDLLSSIGGYMLSFEGLAVIAVIALLAYFVAPAAVRMISPKP